MTSQGTPETGASSPLDSVLLALAFLSLVGGVVAFYWFEGQFIPVVRVLMVLGGLALCAGLAYQTDTGKMTWSYIRGSNIELRKTTWPSRQESLQATLMIAIVVLLTAFLLWLLDSGLLWGVKAITGRG